jgi:hypothetical protein
MERCEKWAGDCGAGIQLHVHARIAPQHMGFWMAVRLHLPFFKSSISYKSISSSIKTLTAPRYFQSWFHSFDAVVIVAGFTTDVLLHGILEEVASLVVVLRLWRFFKIIEEFSVGAEEQMAGLEFRIEQLESENSDLKRELKKQKGTLDEEEEIVFQSGNGQRK